MKAMTKLTIISETGLREIENHPIQQGLKPVLFCAKTGEITYGKYLPDGQLELEGGGILNIPLHNKMMNDKNFKPSPTTYEKAIELLENHRINKELKKEPEK